MKAKLSNAVDFSLVPTYVYQSGKDGLQVPMATIVRLGKVVEASVELGVYSGDDFSFRGVNGGRLATGASLTVKLGPILAHAGAGVASLLTGGAYPTLRDSAYLEVNAEYAK
jgi:hypothetical protein